MQESIFVSIASYCDPLLLHTIQDAICKARHPDRLRFGVTEQQVAPKRLTLANDAARLLVRYVGVEPVESRGVCWARALANTLYEGEDWVLQIDSHMLFEPDWDVRLIESARLCQAKGNPKVIVSSYPNHFEFVEGVATPKPVTNKVLAHVVKPEEVLSEETPVLNFMAVAVEVNEPVAGFHLAAGCLFAPGRFLSEVPYDPQLYFNGEEQTLALRAYTHGWDIWHPCGLPIYHLYDLKPEENTREKHWSEESNKQRYRKFWEFEEGSKRRLKALLYERADLGVHGLGNQRSLREYIHWSGINYLEKQLHPRAKMGHWHDDNLLEQNELESTRNL